MNWHEYYFSLLPVIASKSKDASTKVGAIIVGPDNEIRSTGFNSFPRSINDRIPSRQERPGKYFYVEHAERNAIYNAARMGTSLNGCRIYMEYYPCADCARAIIQSGITEIVLDGRSLIEREAYWSVRWTESITAAKEMLSEANVSIYRYGDEDVRQYL